jgi:hypothetical protein
MRTVTMTLLGWTILPAARLQARHIYQLATGHGGPPLFGSLPDLRGDGQEVGREFGCGLEGEAGESALEGRRHGAGENDTAGWWVVGQRRSRSSGKRTREEWGTGLVPHLSRKKPSDEWGTPAYQEFGHKTAVLVEAHLG